MRKLLTAGVVTLLLSGCVLAPQTIELNTVYELETSQISPQRDALVRVIDQRQLAGDMLGTRGGRLPENSPLFAQQELSVVITSRLQNSLSQLGFGGASPLEPVKVQMDINQFEFRCNEGIIVNECGVTAALQLTVISDTQRFTKPYSVTESRGLAASPNEAYNQKWVNEVLDKLWRYIFSDQQFRDALGVVK